MAVFFILHEMQPTQQATAKILQEIKRCFQNAFKDIVMKSH